MKECIILGGGFGTRLQSVVKDVPKCMAEVAGKPFLYYLFRYLEGHQVTRIILSLGYKSEVVIDWLKAVSFPFDIDYVIENEPLGTGGAIRFAMSKANSEEVLVLNGDTFFDVDLPLLYDFHHNQKADLSLALKPMADFDRYGSVELNEEGLITDFNEKRFCKEGVINGGVYLINKNIFNQLTLPEKFSFEKDILENKVLGLKITGYIENAYFIDIGIPSDFEKANTDFRKFEND